MTHSVLREGNRGAEVLELTTLLEKRGHLDSSDRVFNRAVRRAVEEFQARHVDSRGRPLVVDGVVGPLTWWALENEVEVLAPAGGVDFSVMPRRGGSPRGRGALAVAIAEMKAGAREVGANNSGPFVEKYLNGILTPPANWCAAFVSWCFSQHADGTPFRYSLGARDIRFQFKDKGWLYEGEDPQPGDIIVWWRGQPDGWKGHIGLVHHCANGVVYTIEGNKGAFPARVRGFDYVLGRIDRLLGFGRVPDGGS